MEKLTEHGVDFTAALQKVFEAAITNEKTIAAASKQLRISVETMDRQSQDLPKAISRSVEQMLSDAAIRAACRVGTAFAEADTAAVNAKVRYEQSAQRATRSFAKVAACSAAGSFVGVAAGLGIVLHFVLPPADILQQERDAVQVVASLMPRGGKSILTRCSTSSGDRLCVRTDESAQSTSWGQQGTTYRIVYGY